jgi:excinuclease UvrABC nuclease subunit
VHPEDQRKRKRDLKLYQAEVLEAIPGIGPNLAKELIKKFGTLSGVFAATAEELAEIPGWEDGQPAMLAELFALKG